jgi:hypothetical protein
MNDLVDDIIYVKGKSINSITFFFNSRVAEQRVTGLKRQGCAAWVKN